MSSMGSLCATQQTGEGAESKVADWVVSIGKEAEHQMSKRAQDLEQKSKQQIRQRKGINSGKVQG